MARKFSFCDIGPINAVCTVESTYHLTLKKINSYFQILVQRGNDGDYPKILFQVSVINKIFSL
jgi:hypothetical protein